MILNASGKFIVLEGLEGSGKSTQTAILERSLPNSRLTREPTDSLPGSLCREVILGKGNLTQGSLALLLIADRIEHLNTCIAPALKRGQNIICDRYYLSNMAYQASDSLSNKDIYELNKKFGALSPDLTIFLEITPPEAMRRVNLRKAQEGIFDNLEILERINRNYQEALDFLISQGEKVVKIQAMGNKDDIAKEIQHRISIAFSHHA